MEVGNPPLPLHHNLRPPSHHTQQSEGLRVEVDGLLPLHPFHSLPSPSLPISPTPSFDVKHDHSDLFHTDDLYASLLPSTYKGSACGDCGGCGRSVDGRFILSVGSSTFHCECLRCSQCSSALEENKSCFMREESIYCGDCYHQRFSCKCTDCGRKISSTDWVRRAHSNVYHIACFICHKCKRQLSTGEQFAIQDNRLLCKQHYVELVEGESAQSKQKAKRVRTTFLDDQLNVLQAHFQIDSNPDGADLERIATLTGLSKRVTQVWFQNSRARQKKYQGSKGKAAPGTSAAAAAERASSSRGVGSFSSEDALSPRSMTSNEECSTHSQTEDRHQLTVRSLPVSMSLQPIDYDSSL